MGEWYVAFSGITNVLDIITASCHNRVMEAKKYTIDELVNLTGFSRRTIRYYVQEGLIEPPAGRGRGGFYYDSHLERLLSIKAYRGRGVALSAMASLLKEAAPGGHCPVGETIPVGEIIPSGEAMIRYAIAPGVDLSVGAERDACNSKEILEIIRFAKSILRKGGKQ